MGIAVSRLGDFSAGHTPYNARPSITASLKCFADGIGVDRLGDTWLPHITPSPHPTPDTTVVGSMKCFADGLSVGRVGDLISCGDTIANGSLKTFSQ